MSENKMEIHKVKCDRCGRVENMRKGDFEYHLPIFWRNINKNWFVNKDICPKCINEIKKDVEKLFNKK